MNRWLFLGGSAVVGLLLYLIFSVNHSGSRSSRPFSQGGASVGSNGPMRWNDLASSELPPPRIPSQRTGESFPRSVSTPAPPNHPLDTSSTVYLDGGGPGSTKDRGLGLENDPLVLSAIGNVLKKSLAESPELARKAEEIRREAGGVQGALGEGSRIPAGSELHVVVLKTVEGPGNRLPVIARMTAASLSGFHLPKGTKILGYPEAVTRENRLRIRFVRILYPGGFEAHTTGFALHGGREGVPVEVSEHKGRNIARSVAQNSLMLGGEAVDTMGWSGASMGDFLGMQAGGNALAEAGSQLPQPDSQPSYRLEQGTRCAVMILEGFPVPGRRQRK